ncbi:MAG: hypothetical protein LIV11_08385 [Bacillota bacterium]|nr:hypothetical protein [Bacillota bacterium]
MILNRAFTRKEKALLFLLAIILAGLLYYETVYRALDNARTSYNLENLQNEYQLYLMKSTQIKKMNEAIRKGREESESTVESYNNLKNEIVELNDIFAEASYFNFSFEQATAVDDAVRRTVTASFNANSYADARRMLERLYHCKYRCLIRDIAIDGEKEQDLAAGAVKCTFTVTFYETMYNAWTTDGLAQEKGSAGTKTENIVNELVTRREEVEHMQLD